jgi:hypothetical protein
MRIATIYSAIGGVGTIGAVTSNQAQDTAVGGIGPEGTFHN